MFERDNWLIKYFCELKTCSWQRFVKKLWNEHLQIIGGLKPPIPLLPTGLIEAKRSPGIRMQADTNAQVLKNFSYSISKNIQISSNFVILLSICFSNIITLQTEALLVLLSSILQHYDIGSYGPFGIPYF